MGMPRLETHQTATGAVQNCLATQPAGSVYVELKDARAGAHLGWIFEMNDRSWYCVNSAALHFVPEGVPIPVTCWNPIMSQQEKGQHHGAQPEFASVLAGLTAVV